MVARLDSSDCTPPGVLSDIWIHVQPESCPSLRNPRLEDWHLSVATRMRPKRTPSTQNLAQAASLPAQYTPWLQVLHQAMQDCI